MPRRRTLEDTLAAIESKLDNVPAAPSRADLDLHKLASALRNWAPEELTYDVLESIRWPDDPGPAPTGTEPNAGLRKLAHELRVAAAEEDIRQIKLAYDILTAAEALTLLRDTR